MPELPRPDAGESPAPAGARAPLSGSKRKKSKTRDAWITFISRIVAQVVGAIASIVLAVMFLQRSQSSGTPEPPLQPAATLAPPAAAASDRTTLAVLPLANFSGDERQDYFADGMTESLMADLAQVGNLRVISRTSVMQYRRTQKPMRQIAQELGAQMIVEGSVLRSGDRIRVTAPLIDASTDHHLWARSYEHTLRDVLALQGQVASEIAKEVRGALTPLQQGRLSQRKPIDPAPTISICAAATPGTCGPAPGSRRQPPTLSRRSRKRRTLRSPTPGSPTSRVEQPRPRQRRGGADEGAGRRDPRARARRRAGGSAYVTSGALLLLGARSCVGGA